MKRKTETNKWNDKWFLGLTPLAKLLLGYLYDNCDEAGFIDPIYIKWETEIGEKKDKIIKALIELKQALVSNKKKLFIKDFLTHQEKLPLNPEKKQDRWIISKLEANLPKFENNSSITNILETKILKPEPKQEIVKTKKTIGNTKFVAPKIKEFTDYYLTQKADAEEADIINLYDHYISCGWKVGNKPMKDWEAAIRTSIRREEKFSPRGNSSSKNHQGSKIQKIRDANETMNIDYEELGKR